ncbi:MAG: HDOD domain-containing protein [Gammaproteobacteria bacterium]|nr:HDOD domain-containing protein [Gammaproteobacteria bacterium]
MAQCDPELLKYLVPFDKLPIGDRLKLAARIEYIQLAMDNHLYAKDTEQYILYLLEGKLDFCEQYLQPVILKSSDERAHYPLFSESEDQDTHVVAITDCKLLRVERDLFNLLIEKEIIVEDNKSRAPIGHVESSIYNEIVKAVETGTLQLPSLPEIALRVKKAIDTDVDIDDVVRIVEFDPAMAARLIQVANSPMTRGVDPINSIRDVIVRLGMKMTRNLVTTLAIKQLFKTRHSLLKQRMKKLYAHSIEIAAISYALATRIKKFDADELLLAGLIHDIGVIPVLAYIENTGLEIENEKEVDDIVAVLRSAVGNMVVKNWEFPVEMIAVVDNAENWYRDSGRPLDMADIVIVAQVYNLLQHKQLAQLPDIHKIPAFKKLFPEQHDPKFAMDVIEQAKQEVAEVKRLLSL